MFVMSPLKNSVLNTVISFSERVPEAIWHPENIKIIKGSYAISPEGNLYGKLNIVSKGLQYDNEFGKEYMKWIELIKAYKGGNDE